MTRSQRQVFQYLQVVMFKRGGYGNWGQAIVVVPDIERKEGRYHMDKGRTLVAVHDVEVWPVDEGWYGKRYRRPVADFRTQVGPNTRKSILGLEEYDATVGAEKRVKAAAWEERKRVDAADRQNGLHIITQEMREALGVGAEHDEAIAGVLSIYVDDSVLRREGRGREQ